jgi:hypothetical protein
MVGNGNTSGKSAASIVCWAFVAERPHVENGPDEEKYFEGMVLVDDGD